MRNMCLTRYHEEKAMMLNVSFILGTLTHRHVFSCAVFPSSTKVAKVTRAANGKSSNSTSTHPAPSFFLTFQVPKNHWLHDFNASISSTHSTSNGICGINRNCSMPRRLLPNPANLRPRRLRQENRQVLRARRLCPPRDQHTIHI